jgi:hypothetical protein
MNKVIQIDLGGPKNHTKPTHTCTYKQQFTCYYWKIFIKLCLKCLSGHVILWTATLTEGNSCVFNKISHKVMLVTTVEVFYNVIATLTRSVTYSYLKSLVRHCLTRKEQENNNNKVCLTCVTFSWIFLAHVTFLSPVLLLPHRNSVSSLVPWKKVQVVSMEILMQYVRIFCHHINSRSVLYKKPVTIYWRHNDHHHVVINLKMFWTEYIRVLYEFESFYSYKALVSAKLAQSLLGKNISLKRKLLK